MECAMMFPGQGSQYSGMGKDYYDEFGEVRELYKRANRTLGFDIADLSFAGDIEELTLTHNAQPAILLHSLATLEVLRSSDFVPQVVAGHSLGEFSALVAARYFEPMDALLIVRKRGELMYEAGLEQPGTMAAVMGLDEAAVRKSVEEAASEGIIVIANYNCPGQYAVSGEVQAVERAIEIVKERGARRAMKLQVSGAFHSPLMESTTNQLARYMKKFASGGLSVPWIPNVTGEIVSDETQVPELLSRQLSSPVLWTKSVKTLIRNAPGVPLVEVGPGKVLTGLMKRIDAEARAHPTNSVADFMAIRKGVN